MFRYAGGAPLKRHWNGSLPRYAMFESELAVIKAEQDPLGSQIFDTAYGLGFRGGLDEWERLMEAVARR